ncbi:hypothetical protein HZA98_03515 [Candidatus Woesearchaeota archaeon]|nr:hypothetical protein [Candidatus Woesearchaeota archaeon]
MKFFLFFLLLLPSVSALAVSPGHISSGDRELFVQNTEAAAQSVRLSGIIEKNISLAPKESLLIPLNQGYRSAFLLLQNDDEEIFIPVEEISAADTPRYLWMGLLASGSILSVSIYGWKRRNNAKKILYARSLLSQQ